MNIMHNKTEKFTTQLRQNNVAQQSIQIAANQPA